MNSVRLERREYRDDGVFGVLKVGTKEWYTVERPWHTNKPKVSCIPLGDYAMKKRSSGVVERSTGGAYTVGWEVTNVPDRTYIMIHPGNTMDDLQGCIAPGKQMGRIGGKQAVLSSRPAFDELMKALASQDEWTLTIVDAP